MKIVKALFAFYINSSIHVAFAVTALLGVTQLNFTINLGWVFYAFVFLGTITGYNFVKYAKVAGLHHRSLTRGLKEIQVFSMICAFCLVIVITQLPINLLLYILGFGVITFFYAVPFALGYNLRSITGIKIFVVALVWAGITVVVPLVLGQEQFTTQVVLVFLQRFMLVIIWILPFEIRDVSYDKLSLSTMPQQLGVNRTIVVGLLLLVAVLGIEFYNNNGQLGNISAAIIMCLLSGIALIESKKAQGIYFASFWVESIPIAWFLVVHFFFQFSF